MKRNFIQKWRLIYFIPILMLSLSACKQNQELVEPPVVDSELQQAKTVLSEIGYDISDLIEFEDSYIVEGDLLFTKDQIKELAETPLTKQAYIVNKGVPRDLQKRISINWSPRYIMSESTEWYVAFIEALGKWNSVPGSNIAMQTGTGGYVINITESDGYNAPITISLMGTSATIRLNTSDSKIKGMSASKKLYSAMHALGHAIGFGHTGPPIGGSDYDIMYEPERDFDNITREDSESIMMRNSFTNTRTSLSYGDQRALRALYPVISSFSIKGPANLSNILENTEVTFSLLGTLPAEYNRIEWSGASIISGQGTASVRVKFPTYGNKTLKATVIMNAQDVTFPTSINLSIKETIPVLKITRPTTLTNLQTGSFGLTCNLPDNQFDVKWFVHRYLVAPVQDPDSGPITINPGPIQIDPSLPQVTFIPSFEIISGVNTKLLKVRFQNQGKFRVTATVTRKDNGKAYSVSIDVTVGPFVNYSYLDLKIEKSGDSQFIGAVRGAVLKYALVGIFPEGPSNSYVTWSGTSGDGLVIQSGQGTREVSLKYTTAGTKTLTATYRVNNIPGSKVVTTPIGVINLSWEP